ncbi:hypothetical protein A2U01_0022396, partial [Trifolium medium]|nr:hypothetical protein [Trifolium medium]
NQGSAAASEMEIEKLKRDSQKSMQMHISSITRFPLQFCPSAMSGYAFNDDFSRFKEFLP